MKDAPVIYVKSIEQVAMLSIELMKLGIQFDCRSNGSEWVFELTGY